MAKYVGEFICFRFLAEHDISCHNAIFSQINYLTNPVITDARTKSQSTANVSTKYDAN